MLLGPGEVGTTEGSIEFLGIDQGTAKENLRHRVGGWRGILPTRQDFMA
jgi:hypothetical protein